MLQKYKTKREEGFTIIEVLIVLAIAGLIILIVFLAVPALQRNSRNTQRTNDASRLSAAINECLNNNNGKVDDCDDFGAAKLNTYITIADNQQLVNDSGAALDGVALAFSTKCDDAGNAAISGGGGRAYTLTYKVETSGSGEADRCLGS